MMHNHVAPFAILLLTAFAASATAKEFPRWDIGRSCQGFAPIAHCLETEAAARRQVGGNWQLLPDEVRETCLSELQDPADHSYRTLSECVTRVLRTGPQPKNGASPAAPPQPKADQASVPTKPAMTTAPHASSALAKLLAERASWGTKPSMVSVDGKKTNSNASALAQLLAERAAWGTAPSRLGSGR